MRLAGPGEDEATITGMRGRETGQGFIITVTQMATKRADL